MHRALSLLFRQMMLMALVAVGLVILGGVLMSSLGALLIIAVGMFLIWLPVHSFFCGRNQGLPHYWHRAKRFGCRLHESWRPYVTQMNLDLEQAREQVRTWAGRTRIYLTEMASGALVGGLLGLVCRSENPGAALALGACVGLAVGTLVAIQRNRT